MTGSVRFRSVYQKFYLKKYKITSFIFSVQAMTLNRIEVNNGREKSKKLIEISFRLLTRLFSLAMILTFKTKVKGFGSH